MYDKLWIIPLLIWMELKQIQLQISELHVQTVWFRVSLLVLCLAPVRVLENVSGNVLQTVMVNVSLHVWAVLHHALLVLKNVNIPAL